MECKNGNQSEKLFMNTAMSQMYLKSNISKTYFLSGVNFYLNLLPVCPDKYLKKTFGLSFETVNIFKQVSAKNRVVQPA